MNNIKDMDTFLVEWKSLENTDAGLIVDGDVTKPITDKDDIDDINQSINRAQKNDMKKMCGGIRYFENEYDNGLIKILYGDKPISFEEKIENENIGYVSLKELNIEEPSKDLFYLKYYNLVGNGEVLLSCMFPDVNLTRRTSKSGQIKDCETSDHKYDIEIKSRGAEFYFKGFEHKKSNEILPKLNKLNDKEIKKDLICKPIAEYIISRYENKPLIFICYDNKKDEIPDGFFWLKYNGETETEEDLINTLASHIKLSGQKAEHKNKFSIVAGNPKENKNDLLLICYCSLLEKFDEIKKSEV